MAATTTALRRQIGSANDLQSVVRTMKASAAAAIGQYESSVAALAGYAQTVERGLGVCLRSVAAPGAMAGSESDGNGGRGSSGVSGGSQPVHAVVFGSDQGLVGRFNEDVVAHALAHLAHLAPLAGTGGARAEAVSASAGTTAGTTAGNSGSAARPVRAAATRPARVWAVGQRVQARLLDAGLAPVDTFEVPGSVQLINGLVGQILQRVPWPEHPGGDEATGASLLLFYNRPAGAGYEPVVQRLLPLDARWQHELAGRPWPTQALPEVLGSAPQALRALVREHLFVSLFRASAESLASENASRLAAMQRAERNIGDMLAELGAEFHRRRQSGIDEELFDVLAGFDAMAPQ